MAGWFPDEALGMSDESGVQHHLAMGQDMGSLAVVDCSRCHQAETGVVVLVVVPPEEGLAEAAGVSMEPKRFWKPGRYLRVRNWLSEYGLSSETCGRLWVLTTPGRPATEPRVWIS